MGGTKQYEEYGEIREPEYKQVGVTSNGIKILEKIDENNNSNNSPMKSNTAYTMYANNDRHSGKLKQISVYGGKDGHSRIKDIDYGHRHTNTDGTKFSEREIHVHLYSEKGRSKEARKPSKKERRLMMMALYGRS